MFTKKPKLLSVITVLVMLLTSIIGTSLPVYAAPNPSFILISPDPTSVGIGATKQFAATLVYDDWSTQDVTNSATWTSGNNAVATISATGLATGVSADVVNISASYSGVSGNALLNVGSVKTIKSLTIVTGGGFFTTNQQRTYMYKLMFSDATQLDLSALATWSSSDPSIATATGPIIKAVGTTGTAKITASYNGIVGNSYATIDDGSGGAWSTITPGSISSLEVGQPVTFTATNHIGGVDQDTTNTGTWISSEPNVASFVGNVLTPHEIGQTFINFEYNGVGGGYNFPVKAVTSVTVSPTNSSIQTGQTQSYTATAHFSDASTLVVTNTATWASSDLTKATMAGKVATGVAAGSTVVSAYYHGQTGTANLTVTAAPPVLQSITVTPATASILVGNAQAYTATANYSDSSTVDVTATSVWTSSDLSKATMASNIATGVAAGTSIITATFGGQSGTANLTVTAAPPVLQSITVTPATASILVGNTQAYTATANYSNSSTVNVTTSAAWSIADPSKATMAANVATGVAAGSTVVSAVYMGLTGSATLTVTNAPPPPPPVPTLSSITVSPATASILVGNTQAYTATAHYSDASTLDVTALSLWTSDNIIRASMLGSTATGLSAGTTGVTATYSGLTGSATLTVTPVVIPPSGGGGGGGGYVPPIIPPSTLPSLDKIIVSPDPSSIAVGATQTYTATADYSDGSTTNVSDTATWSNSDTSIATMNGKVATGINGGSTIITATFNGKTGTATLNVTNIGEIKGQVREAVTSKPLAGADVLALGTDLVPVTVKTDENGDYEFDHLNFGNYVIALKVGDTFVIKMIVVQ